MKQALLERCEAQIRAEDGMRKVSKIEYEQVLKLCAMMHVNAGQEVDTDRVKDCARILRGKAGFFSNFRGTLERILIVKMALSDDPEAYISEVMAVYEQLRTGIKLPGEMVVMASSTIVENCPAEEREGIIQKTQETYRRLRELHPFLTDDSDMSLIALMILAGKDAEQAANEAENLFQAMKRDYKISSDVAQSAAIVLALSDKPAEQKLAAFFDLYRACKERKHATAKDKAMVVYSAFSDVDYDTEEVASAIGEVEDWLKGQKGYGALVLGINERRLFAAAMVLEDLKAGSAASESSVTGAVTQAVVEELVLILVMIIVTGIIISNTVVQSF